MQFSLSLLVFLATITSINAAAFPDPTPAPVPFAEVAALHLEPRAKPKIPKPHGGQNCGTATITSGGATSTVTGDAACDATETADDDDDASSTSSGATAAAQTSSSSRAGAMMAGGEINLGLMEYVFAGLLGLYGLVL